MMEESKGCFLCFSVVDACFNFHFSEVEILLVTVSSSLLLVAHTSSPIRVTLADKNVCNTNTIGFGQECRSTVCGEKI